MGQWVLRAMMPTPRHDLQAISVGGEIYALSGADDLTLDTVEIYDVATNRWRSGPAIGLKRGWFGAAMIDEQIYAIGGKTIRPLKQQQETGDPGNYTIHHAAEVFDVPSQTWSAISPLAAPRAGLAVTVCNDRIYAMGGNAMNNETRNGGQHLDAVEVYDPPSATWSASVPTPVPVQGAVLATVDNCIYLTAGMTGLFETRTTQGDTFVFNPDDEKWEKRAPIPTPRCDAASIAVDRKIYTFGGWSDGWSKTQYFNSVEVYDVSTDTWSILSPLPEPKAWMGAAAVGERIFVMGGAYRKPDDSGYKWINDLHEFIS